MSEDRKPLTNALQGSSPGECDDFVDFDRTAAAAAVTPVPQGSYTAVAVEGGLKRARTGTPGYCVGFEVIEGEYAGRRLWRTWFLTPAALPYTRRDLLWFGLDRREKLFGAFPADRYVCRLGVALRTLDNDTQVNDVRSLEVIRVQEPQRDPFAPTADVDSAAAFEALDAPDAAGEGRA